MLVNQLIKSLALIFTLITSAHVVAQSHVYRGHSNEPLPALILPQDGLGPYNQNKMNRIQIGNAQWSQAGEPDDFNVYPDLSIDFIRKYNFKITPMIRKSGQLQTLPDGYYYLRIALFKPNLKKKPETFEEMTDQYITGIERVVRADGGVISTPVSFSFPMLSATTMRNRMLLEVIPLKQEFIKTQEYLGTEVVDLKKSKFIADTDSSSVVMPLTFAPEQLTDYGNTVEKTLRSDVTYNGSFEISALMLEGVRKLNNKMSSINTPTLQEWSKNNKLRVYLNDSLFERYSRLENKNEMCSLLSENLEYKAARYKNTTVELRARQMLKNFCISENNSFAFQKIQFINPDSTMDAIKGQWQRHGVNTQIVVSLSKGNNSSKAYDQSESTSAGLSINPLEFFGIKIPGLSLNRNYTATESLSHSNFQSGVMAENFILAVRRLTLNVEASKVRSCYMLQFNQKHSELQPKHIKEYLEYFFGKDRSWGGHIVCQTHEGPTTFQETYFHILPAFTAQGIADSNDPRNQPVNLSLRSYQDFNLFKYQIRKSLSDQYDANVMPDNVLTSSVVTNTEPGVHIVNKDIAKNKRSLGERIFYNKENLRFD